MHIKVSRISCVVPLDKHLKNHQLLPDYQNAYREHFSCENALLHIHNNVLWAMEHLQCVALCAIDLSVAFDTVNHQVLLLVLPRLYGVSVPNLQLFHSYLRPRAFKVALKCNHSTYKTNRLFCTPRLLSIQTFTDCKHSDKCS